ncbi:MAG TPA: DUF748 domain-containing protein [Verrucomicrobiae bacterium]|jgi:hypothetical protein
MESRGRRWRPSPAVYWTAIIVAAVLIAGRLIMPVEVQRYVNGQLNRSKDYGGRIGNVHIQLWRGQYRIDNTAIFQRNGEVHTPLFNADQIFLSVEWKELFHGSVVGQVSLERPRLNFAVTPTGQEAQNGKGEDWGQMLESLFPFKLNRLQINDGEIHFQNEHSTPPVDIYVSKCSVTATNLTNSRQVHNELPAGITAHGTSLGGGNFDFHVQLNPMAAQPTFQVTAQITNVNLPALNDFLKAYGKFDVASGEFAFFTSIASKDGNFDGYGKVFFEKLKVFAWDKERKKNILEIFWQAVVGTVTTALKNQPHDYLAARFPISGAYGKEKIGVWPAIVSLLRNAFIKALVPKLDTPVTLRAFEDKEKNEEKPDK